MSAIPPAELPILESLVHIRNRLTALKKDSGQYIRAQDVLDIYKAVIKQVTRLNTVRDDAATEAASSADAEANSNNTTTEAERAAVTSSSQQESHSYPDVPALNRVDTTLNDVFSLLSLFFLTIGRNRETPAAFCQISTMKQLLDHLAEGGVYTESDLEPFSKRLTELRSMIRADADGGRHPPALTKLMMRKLETCERVLKNLQATLKVLSVELVPIHQRLISVRRQIVAAAAKPKLPRAEIRHLQEELRSIDSKRVDGKFLGPGGSSVPAGQAILVGILEECFEICHEINVRNDEVPMTLQPIYDRLVQIKQELEHLVLTHRWTLRETDLWNYQVSLKEIDRLRVNGKFVDSEGKQPEGQPVLLYLLRRCYGLIYRLVASSEPIGEELMPVSNKLSTISKCLKEVSKYGGPYTMRDLYPYRLALHQIDSMRTEIKDKEENDTGVRKWLAADGSTPEGQAILRAQFEEVLQTIEEMLNESDDDSEEVEDAEDDDSASASESEEGYVEPGVVSEEEDPGHSGWSGWSASTTSGLSRSCSQNSRSTHGSHNNSPYLNATQPLHTGLDRLSLGQLSTISNSPHGGAFSLTPAQPSAPAPARPPPFADDTPKPTAEEPVHTSIAQALAQRPKESKEKVMIPSAAASTTAPSASASHCASPTADGAVNVLWSSGRPRPKVPSRSVSNWSTASNGMASATPSDFQSIGPFSPLSPASGAERGAPLPDLNLAPLPETVPQPSGQASS